MTASPASLSVLALAGCLLLAGFAATGTAHAAPPLYAFQIPAQPLADALRAYGLITGISVLAPSGVLRQRYSSAVEGSFAAPEALQRMLSGTGLQAHFPAANAAIIQLPAGEPPAAPPLPPESGAIALDAIDAVHADGADYGAYVSGVQAQLLRVLCRSSLTRPGSYRLALRLRIAASGSVATLKQAGSTGRPLRDAVISRSLRAQVFEPPPPAMPQPITILLRQDDAGSACQPAPSKDQADAR
ncbi:hypothetical protein CLU91_0431 [Janthinobacterium sp. 64]|nr:hypothetical protein CLU91_0431 [Janthinobacterium sp. 64]